MKIVVTEASTTEANIPQVVLITGAKSQLAEALLRIAANIGELALNSITSANSSTNTGALLELYALSRSQLDITDAANIAAVFDQYRPSWVINCAAYNAVDAAEHDAIEANRVNALGPELLAQQCLLSGARLLHVSSDYVFGGQAVCEIAHAAERVVCDARESGVEQHQNPDSASNSNSNPNPNQVHLPRPFVELDAPKPFSAYGKSKLLGEQRVVAVLGDCATIVRTSWLYGQDGHNFVNTMLNLMRTQPSLQVIADQIGCPTWSDALAKVIWQLVMQQRSGVFHYSAQGQCSWYEFASEIQRQALALNLLSQPVDIQPITSAHYAKQALNRGVGLAKRPSYSVLNSGKLRSTLVTNNTQSIPDNVEWQDWRQQLNCMLRRLS
ncbi:SDR family oxidoreductase [Shewanella baltica]|uniref:SDR family oxidoreductase n=1 Tax=Shewanella baltica TaxID=62322 RepID=UPI003D7B60DE